MIEFYTGSIAAYGFWKTLIAVTLLLSYFLGNVAFMANNIWDDLFSTLKNVVNPTNMATRSMVGLVGLVVLVSVSIASMFILPVLGLIAFFVKICEGVWDFINKA